MSEPSSLVETNGLCRCGHTGKAHPLMGAGHPCTNHGCDCRAFVKVPLPTVINDCCKCSHDRFRHCYDTVDGPCSKPDCDCKAYAPVTVETVELPEPKHSADRAHEDCPTCWEASEAECMCCTPALADEPWAPPQPERRPPLTVQYSVAGGHPYEVSIPGDASVTAEDGVLIIKHPSAQILAITRVAPMEGP